VEKLYFWGKKKGSLAPLQRGKSSSNCVSSKNLRGVEFLYLALAQNSVKGFVGTDKVGRFETKTKETIVAKEPNVTQFKVRKNGTKGRAPDGGRKQRDAKEISAYLHK